MSHLPLLPAVVDDLLSAFMGENGSYVRAKLLHAPGGTRLGFEVVGRGQLEAALQEMTARMLPLWCVWSCAAGWQG
jgi:hypothetical protein